MKMNKRLAIIAAIILLVLIPAFSTAWAASWVKMVYDPEVPSQARENFQKAVDTVDVLFTKYKIILSDPVTVVMTANDAESFIRALMLYGNYTRQAAELAAAGTVGDRVGLSLRNKPVVVIRYTPLTTESISLGFGPLEGYLDLPHELFHQVEHQYTRVTTATWLSEGPADLFGRMALEAAGFKSVTRFVRQAEQKISKAAAIPDIRQLASNDYKTWISLRQQRYPVYGMAFLMTYRLVGDNGFGKVILYYQLLDNGSDPDKAFNTAFGVRMSDFLTDMNDYFNNLRQPKKGIGTVGIGLSKAQPQLVMGVMQGMPAAEAGIKIGDRILRVDGKDAKGLSGPQMVELLTGQAGSRVTIEVERQGETKPLSFTLIRKALD